VLPPSVADPTGIGCKDADVVQHKSLSVNSEEALSGGEMSVVALSPEALGLSQRNRTLLPEVHRTRVAS
jgi:hypothetical protein